ncbi:MAG: ADP-forming succinate--CoA ligase subunit beta [Myxococcota bacterium]|nr:ADP-forming succinate--CoA ligase subunit beta [Myxococcota bacterium]
MKLHEYQAKDLLRANGVKVPPGIAATTVSEATEAAKSLGGDFWVVKAQVHAGGRGKGRFKEVDSADILDRVVRGEADVPGKGGVQLCRSIDDVQAAAAMMLGNTLVTKQTGIDGVTVKTVLVTTGADIEREIYAAVLLDRQASQLVLMVSAEGGTEIEEVAEENPDAILKAYIDPATGLGDWQCRQLAFKLGLQGAAFKDACRLFKGLYATYLAADCSMLEINPVIVTSEGEVIALDAKVDIDDNAAFRQKDIAAIHDSGEMDPSEVEAAKHHLNFIKLDGNIGCMVNGAGLAMATMDIIKLYGGEPANFLDVGGGAKVDQVKAAFKIISADANVQAIMVNIFGGIMKCDVIAEGVIAAVKDVGLDLPLVVRLAGTNVDLGKQLLQESGLPILTADSMADAAQKAVAATQGA